VFVDGVDVQFDNSSSGIATINAGLFPAASGETHTFQVRPFGGGLHQNDHHQSANVTSTPVQNVGNDRHHRQGRLHTLQRSHCYGRVRADLMRSTRSKRRTLPTWSWNIRYNGGGYLAIASELAFMVAAALARAASRSSRSSSTASTRRPIRFTGDVLAPVPSLALPNIFSRPSGQPLPALNLSRVFVLTGSGTCSASESIINSLRGVGVQVIQVGSTTCGKPYGFYPDDNCGTTYFSIQFKGVNAAGFGDYTDGFSPSNTAGGTGTRVPGCSVADDFAHALGDPNEGRLAAGARLSHEPDLSGAVGIRPAAGLEIVGAGNGRL